MPWVPENVWSEAVGPPLGGQLANVPTALFLAAWQNLIGVETALLLSQVLCVVVLAVLGGRAGWGLDRRWFPALLGAIFAGGICLLLTIVKHVIH